jgi:hypothetical protein
MKVKWIVSAILATRTTATLGMTFVDRIMRFLKSLSEATTSWSRSESSSICQSVSPPSVVDHLYIRRIRSVVCQRSRWRKR